MNKDKTLQLLKTGGAWLFVAFSVLMAIGAGACVGSVLLVVTAIFALPVKPIQNIWDKVLGVKDLPELSDQEQPKWWQIKRKNDRRKYAAAKKDRTQRKAIKPVIIFVAFCISFSTAMASSETPTTPPSESVTASESEEPPADKSDITVASEPTEEPTTEPAAEPTETATSEPTAAPTSEPTVASYSLADIPAYSGTPYVALNNNIPYFTDADFTTASFESYSSLDSLGRCGVAYANVGLDTMPTEKRGSIGQVKPSGWHTVKYDIVDGKYLYNRCHLIGYQLTAENANTQNLITGTRYLNVEGMLPFENMVADYIKETNNHVLYRVTPIFDGNNLVANGVVMEAESVEDKGEGILFCVYCYNVQPGVVINYTTGDSQLDGTVAAETTPTPAPTETPSAVAPASPAPVESQPQGQTYVLNTNTRKFHNPSCSSVKKIKDGNRQDYTGSRDDVIAMGYDPCKKCNP